MISGSNSMDKMDNSGMILDDAFTIYSKTFSSLPHQMKVARASATMRYPVNLKMCTVSTANKV